MKRIGIFSGTFDPVHAGHLEFARIAAQKAKLNEVYLLPEPQPRHKQNVSKLHIRQKMITDAVVHDENIYLFPVDQPQFTTTRTLPIFRQHFPDSELVLLIGSDVACESLAHWEKLDVLARNVEFVIGIRSTHPIERIDSELQTIIDRGVPLRHTIIESPLAHLSSSRMKTS